MVEGQLVSDAFHVTVPQFGAVLVRAIGERTYRSGNTLVLTSRAGKAQVFDGDGARMSIDLPP